MSKQFVSLDEARVISKLSKNVTYTQLSIKGKNYQVLVVNGVPYEYRIFCSLIISKLAADIPLKLRENFIKQILEFWEAIGYQHPGLDVNKPENGKQFTTDRSWAILNVFTVACIDVNGHQDTLFESADYLEMMQSVSRLMREEKQLRLGDVNNDRVIA